jgi:hypothetical protein
MAVREELDLPLLVIGVCALTPLLVVRNRDSRQYFQYLWAG